MNLSTVWDEFERQAVEATLVKLFLLQHKPLTDEHKETLVQELSIATLPAKAVIAGMQSLMVEELRSIKYATILTAARSCMDQRSAQEAVSCDHCSKSGLVYMVDGSGYEFTLACICPNGNNGIASTLTKWNGELTQVSRKRQLTLRINTLNPVSSNFLNSVQ